MRTRSQSELDFPWRGTVYFIYTFQKLQTVVFLPNRIEGFRLSIIGIQAIHKGSLRRINALQQAVYIIGHVVRVDFGIDLSHLIGKMRVDQDVVNQVVLYHVTVIAFAQHDYIRFLKQFEDAFFGRNTCIRLFWLSSVPVPLYLLLSVLNL